ncbi:unnamed protein product, partial [marine sediment metagenome]
DLVKTGEKYQEAQLKKRSTSGEEYAQKAQAYRAEIEIYVVDRLSNLTKAMKDIFKSEALREYSGPIQGDINALQAWELLSEFDTFVIDINKWTEAFSFDGQTPQAEQQMGEVKENSKTTDFSSKTIEGKKGKAKQQSTEQSETQPVKQNTQLGLFDNKQKSSAFDYLKTQDNSLSGDLKYKIK